MKYFGLLKLACRYTSALRSQFFINRGVVEKDVFQPLDQDFDFSVDFTEFERFLQGLAVDRLNPGRQFVLPAMPGAGHTSVFHFSLGNGAALVCTHAIHGKPLTFPPENSDHPVADDDFPGLTLSQVRLEIQADPFPGGF